MLNFHVLFANCKVSIYVKTFPTVLSFCLIEAEDYFDKKAKL